MFVRLLNGVWYPVLAPEVRRLIVNLLPVSDEISADLILLILKLLAPL
jgi:hypothetical protein